MKLFIATATIITFAAFDGWPAESIDSSPRPMIRRITPIAPDISIVTEVSPPDPYEGQQFGIIYWLRARRPPAAIDINPQQFPSFWTEMVSLQAGGNYGVRQGRGFSDFLLRQVVAFPLLDGPVQLPPISVKVKRARGQAGRGGDWDVLGSAEPVDLKVRAVPGRSSGRQDFPMVGSVAGRWTRSAALNERQAILELEGSAGLALFNPFRALTPASAASVRLMSRESVPQTVDVAGERRISLLTRQRWEVQFTEGGLREGRCEEIAMFVFDPGSASWTQQRIPGILITEGGSETEPATAAAGGPAVGSQARNRFPLAVLLLTAPGLLVAVLILFLLRHAPLRRKAAGGADRREIPGLAKKLKASPQTFLDAAHRIMQRLERDDAQLRISGTVRSELAALRSTVQFYRFGKEPMPPEVRLQILQALDAAASRMRDEAMRDAG